VDSVEKKVKTYAASDNYSMAIDLRSNAIIPIEKLKLQYEMNVSEFPPWYKTLKRQKPLENHRLRRELDNGGYQELVAPLGRPSGIMQTLLDIVLIEFCKNPAQNPVFSTFYSIIKASKHKPSKPGGWTYRELDVELEKLFALFFKSDRFYDRATGQMRIIKQFHILENTGRAEYNGKEDQSWFKLSDEYVHSFRAGYVKTLDTGFCLELDRKGEYLARYLYSYLLKKIGNAPDWEINCDKFFEWIGLGYITERPKKKKNEFINKHINPALERIKGKAFRDCTSFKSGKETITFINVKSKKIYTATNKLIPFPKQKKVASKDVQVAIDKAFGEPDAAGEAFNNLKSVSSQPQAEHIEIDAIMTAELKRNNSERPDITNQTERVPVFDKTPALDITKAAELEKATQAVERKAAELEKAAQAAERKAAAELKAAQAAERKAVAEKQTNLEDILSKGSISGTPVNVCIQQFRAVRELTCRDKIKRLPKEIQEYYREKAEKKTIHIYGNLSDGKEATDSIEEKIYEDLKNLVMDNCYSKNEKSDEYLTTKEHIKNILNIKSDTQFINLFRHAGFFV
jgi:hypothetical protein